MPQLVDRATKMMQQANTTSLLGEAFDLITVNLSIDRSDWTVGIPPTRPTVAHLDPGDVGQVVSPVNLFGGLRILAYDRMP